MSLQSSLSLAASPAGLSVDEGQSLNGLWAILLSTASDDPSLQGTLRVTAIDTGETTGFVSLDTPGGTLGYTASGYVAAAPFDSFGYTISDAAGNSVSGRVTIGIESLQPGLPTIVADAAASSLTGTGYGQRLIANDTDGFTLVGGDGGDVLFGGGGHQTIIAHGYGNTIYGGLGADTIDAGAGNAVVVARDNGSIITAHGYNDRITAGNGPNIVSGALGNATVSLGYGPNQVTLGGYNDVVLTQGGNATILGMAGNATVTTGVGDQTIVLFGYGNTVTIGANGRAPGLLGALSYIASGDGNATVTAGDGTNVILAGGYDDTITVGTGTNLIFATGLDGSLTPPAALPSDAQVSQASLGGCSVTLGDGHNWVFLHGYGNTVIDGAGTDVVWSGAGNDRFELASGGALFVRNFAAGGGDRIDLSRILAGTGVTNDLNSLAKVVAVIGTGADDALYGGASDGGTQTILSVMGAHGTAFVHLENAGALSLAELVAAKAIGVGLG